MQSGDQACCDPGMAALISSAFRHRLDRQLQRSVMHAWQRAAEAATENRAFGRIIFRQWHHLARVRAETMRPEREATAHRRRTLLARAWRGLHRYTRRIAGLKVIGLQLSAARRRIDWFNTISAWRTATRHSVSIRKLRVLHVVRQGKLRLQAWRMQAR